MLWDPPPLAKNKSFLRWILNVRSATQYGYQLTRSDALRQIAKVSMPALTSSIQGSVMEEGCLARQIDVAKRGKGQCDAKSDVVRISVASEWW